MKTLKFKFHLVNQILSGSKTVTWRLFDDKDLKVGDELDFVNADSVESFGGAVILETYEKKLGEISDEDFIFSNYKKETPEELLNHYRNIYGDKVDWDTMVKVVKFKLLNE